MENEGLRLKWEDFQKNLQESFRELRSDFDFTDVTLVCEDQIIKAHKIVLSACSPFLKGMLKAHAHPQPLIYMRGVKARDLIALMDFIYVGEASMMKEQLESFLGLAEELEVKGLSGRLGEEAPRMRNSDFKQKQSLIQSEQIKNVKEEMKMKGGNTSNVKSEHEIKMLPIQPKSIHTAYIDADTMAKIDSNIDRQSDGFHCIHCEYTSMRRNHMRDHVETHIEGLEYPCDGCEKVFRSSRDLGKHKIHFLIEFSFSGPATITAAIGGGVNSKILH